MATQGLVSVVCNNKVIMKIVSGCDGYNASKLANELKHYRDNFHIDPIHAYEIAKRFQFGCDNCLYVITENGIFGKSEEDCRISNLENSGEFSKHQLYRESFHKAKFNPRWKLGTADYTIVINVDKKNK